MAARKRTAFAVAGRVREEEVGTVGGLQRGTWGGGDGDRGKAPFHAVWEHTGNGFVKSDYP